MEHINGIKATVVGVLGCLTALWGWFGWLVLAWVACMVLDYATGSAAALRAGEWSSKAARDGLWHKLGAIVAVLVAAILDGVIRLVLENIPALELPFEYTVFVSVLVLVWYILTELGSIVENAGALGAPIPGWLAAAIKVLGSSVDKAGEAVTGVPKSACLGRLLYHLPESGTQGRHGRDRACSGGTWMRVSPSCAGRCGDHETPDVLFIKRYIFR